MTIKIFKYVDHEHVEKYEALGWRAVNSLQGTVHGLYSTLMEWIGPGDPTEPKK